MVPLMAKKPFCCISDGIAPCQNKRIATSRTAHRFSKCHHIKVCVFGYQAESLGMQCSCPTLLYIAQPRNDGSTYLGQHAGMLESQFREIGSGYFDELAIA